MATLNFFNGLPTYDWQSLLNDVLAFGTYTENGSGLSTIHLVNGTDELVITGSGLQVDGARAILAGTIASFELISNGVSLLTDGDFTAPPSYAAVNTLVGDRLDTSFYAVFVPEAMTINGSPSAENIFGSSFNDTINGGSGNDELHGGGGNDDFIPGSGDDIVDGGAGFNHVDYFDYGYDGAGASEHGVIVNLSDHDVVANVDGVDRTIAAGHAYDNWGGDDTLINIQNVGGSDFNDVIVRGDGGSFLRGGDGDDILIGGSPVGIVGPDDDQSDFIDPGRGNDVIDGGGTGGPGDYDHLVYIFAENGIHVVKTSRDAGTVTDAGGGDWVGTDTFGGIEIVVGSDHDDIFDGSTERDDFTGHAGNDIFNGSDGTDQVNYEKESNRGGNAGTQGVVVNLSGATLTDEGVAGLLDNLTGSHHALANFTVADGHARDSFGDTDTLNSIEWFQGTKYSDVIVGDASNNEFQGREGDDILIGGNGGDYIEGNRGNDVLIGGADQDHLYGGNGNDTIIYDGGDDVVDGGDGIDTLVVNAASALTIDLSLTADQSTSPDTAVVTGFENVDASGSTVAVSLTGDAGDNVLAGGAGSDTIDGGGGVNIARYTGSLAFADVVWNMDHWTVSGGAQGTDTLRNISSIEHAGGRFLLVGSGGFADVNAAFAAATQLGDTIVFTDTPTSPIIISAPGDNSNHNLTLPYGVGVEITLGDGNNTITTGGGDDVIVTGNGDNTIHTGGGNDVVITGTGHNVIIAGSGNGDDIYDGIAGADDTIEYPSAVSGVTVHLTPTDYSGHATLASGGASTVGQLLVAHSYAANMLVALVEGPEIDTDVLIAYENVTGSPGDDLFVPDVSDGAANTFDGAGGTDTLDYSASTHVLTVDLASATKTATGTGTGTDTISNFEIFKTGSGADQITGSAADETLRGNGGNDTIDGGGGSGDKAVYSGAWKDYTVALATSTYTIADSRGSPTDGTDQVTNVEQFTFSNGTFAAATILNDAPTSISLSGTHSIAENTANNTVIGSLSSTDADTTLGDTATYTIVGSDGRFYISGANLVVADSTLLDYEAGTSHTVKIRVTDAHGSHIEQDFVISLADVNDVPPVIHSGSTGGEAENTLSSHVVYTVDATDGDVTNNGVTYSLTGTDAALFAISAGGDVTFLNSPDFENPGDADHNNAYLITVHAKDAGNLHDASKNVTITVSNVAGNIINGTNGGNVIDARHGAVRPTSEEDTIKGLGGDDTLSGLGGNDSINGGAGNDKVFGGLGLDTLIGATGKDQFVFDSTLGAINVDTIKAFSHTDDTIVLDHTIFNKLGMGALKATAFFAATFTGANTPKAHDANDRIVYNKKDGSLWYDADGNKAHGLAAIEFAVLDSHPANVAFNDFLVVA